MPRTKPSDVEEANRKISRGDDADEARKKRNAALISPGVLPAAAGALISGEDEGGETKEALERATKRK